MNAAAIRRTPGLGGHAAVLRATAREVRRLSWMALLVLGATGLALFNWRAVAVTFCVTSAVALFITWCAAASALLAQNDPLSARLVPGHLRRLRETALVVFVPLVLACGALLGAVLNHTLVFTMVLAVLMLGAAACLRWPLLWALWGAPWLLLPFQGLPPFRMVLDALRAWHEHQPVTQAAVVLLACAAGVWSLFLAGREGHERSWRRTQRMQSPLSLQGAVKTSHPNRLVEALKRVIQWVEPLWRAHLIRVARPTPASVVARAELAALRNIHWSVTASITPLIFGAFVLAELAVIARWPDKAGQIVHSALPGLSFGLMMATLGPLFSLGTTLHQSRRDQALLALLPGMPRGAAMNRTLAARLMRHHVVSCSTGVAVVVLVAALAPAEDLWRGEALIGLDLAIVALPTGLLLWRDWSRQTLPGGTQAVQLTLILLIGVGLCATARGHWELSPWPLMLGSALLTCAAGAWRWRALRDMPSFWPVGRHAAD